MDISYNISSHTSISSFKNQTQTLTWEDDKKSLENKKIIYD